MQKNNKTILLTLALLLIGIFLISSVFSMKDNTQTVYKVDSTYDSNHFNYYEHHDTENNYVKPTEISHTNKYKSYHRQTNYYTKKTTVNTVHYTQYATEESRKGFLGDYIKEYSTYITNRGQTGRYFTVTFNLEDKNGYEFSQSVTQYLRTGEKKKFVYKDTQYERNEILDWSYKITPQKY
jgi:hypothetical protein